jgi:hypothetical protein
MNQDFALLPTPANARRLLMLQRICPIEVSAEITAIAQRETIGESQFDPLICPHHPVKQAITQFLLDCRLRGIVQANYHPEYNEIALLHTLKLAHADRIHIVTNKPSRWTRPIAALSLERVTHTSLSLFLSKDSIERRDTVLVVDVTMGIMRSRLRVAAQDFPQIIIYQANDGQTNLHAHWVIWAHLLFPGMPHPLYMALVENVPSAWRHRSLAEFAPFYNTCLFPELITDRQLLRSLDDNEVMQSLEYSGMLIS